MKILLEDAFKKIVSFLNEEKSEYFIIGGIAVGALGEPRFTGDIDIDIFLAEKDTTGFFKKAERDGFKVDKQKCRKTISSAGFFQINYGPYHIDFIIASTELEKQVLERKIALKLYSLKAHFPTPEDLILLKIIPGRPQDLIDAERVLIRHKEKLDLKYLRSWAQKLSDETEDLRIYNELQRLLSLK